MGKRYVINPCYTDEQQLETKLNELVQKGIIHSKSDSQHNSRYNRLLEMFAGKWSVEETSPDSTSYFEPSGVQAPQRRYLTVDFRGMPVSTLVVEGVFVEQTSTPVQTEYFCVSPSYTIAAAGALLQAAHYKVYQDDLELYQEINANGYVFKNKEHTGAHLIIYSKDTSTLANNGNPFKLPCGVEVNPSDFVVSTLSRSILEKAGLIIPFKSGSLTVAISKPRTVPRTAKKVTPPGLDNRRNSGTCPHCGTQTVLKAMFTSSKYECPNCGA